MAPIATTTNPLLGHFVPFGNCALNLSSVRQIEFRAPVFKEGTTEPAKGPGGSQKICGRIYGVGNGGLITNAAHWPNGYMEVTGADHTRLLDWANEVGLLRDGVTEEPQTQSAGKK